MPKGLTLQHEVSLRIGPFYERMLPWDLLEGVFCVLAACPPTPGGAIEPLAFARIWGAECIKWPPLVRQWTEDTRGMKTAVDFVRLYVKALKTADGKSYEKMHAAMSFCPRMHSCTGIVANGRQMELLQDVTADATAPGQAPQNLEIAFTHYVSTYVQEHSCPPGRMLQTRA